MPVERGVTLGHYQVVFRLGSGGMGEVWRGRDVRDDREVAIKILSRDAASDPDRLSRFAMEARATSALKHPNILTVYDVGESDAGPYLVTEYVDGSTVRNLLNEGPMPLARAVDVAMQAASGVAEAHALGMVHRDLKPENLMVNRGGVVKILDFGLAKHLRPSEVDSQFGGHTATGMIIGTPGYLSPEQLKGNTASERSDVFALGVVLYEMATGDNPFRRNNPVDTFSAILLDEPPPLDPRVGPVPVELTLALGKALAKKPADRYPSAREFADDLRTIHERLAPPPEPITAAVEVLSRRLPWPLLAGAALLALALGAFLVTRGC
jgi:eukaryotic-like serine/threonine-protein kinase